ncbi:MAG: DMT family transporter [Acidimicrobiales bacterium]
MIRHGLIRCAAAAVLFGVSAPLAAKIADDVSAFTLAGLLYVGAATAVAPWVIRKPPSAHSVRRGGRRLAAAVVFGGAVGPLLLAVGLRHASPSTSSLLLNLELVFTVVIAAVVFREHVGPRVAMGTALVVAASVLLAGGGTDVRAGALLIAAACACWAVDNCVTAGLDELSAASITLVKGIVAGTVNLAIGLVLGGVPPAGVALTALVIGAFGYGASITLWVAGARELGAARGQLVFATAPFVGAVVAWTLLADDVTARAVAALAIAAAGVAMVLRTAHAHEHRHAAVVHDHEHVHDDGHHTHVHADGFTGRHQHPHEHAALVHAHPHLPDLHHRHAH